MTGQNSESKSVWSVKDSYDSLFSFSIFVIVLGFFVGLISKWVSFVSLGLAYWMFGIGVGLMSLLVFLKLFVLIQGFIHDNFHTLAKKIKEHEKRIEREQRKIKKLLKFKIESTSIGDLVYHQLDLEEAKFSREALVPYLAEWYHHVDKVRSLVQEQVEADELEQFEELKKDLLKEIKALKKEKKKEQKLEGGKLQAEKEGFLRKYENCIHVDSSDFTDDQKRWLEQDGFQRTHQWCINKKDSVEFLIKPRHNESLSHAYLTGAIFDYVKRFDSNAKLPSSTTF